MVNNELVISEENKLLFEKIQAGDNTAILQGLIHPGAFYRINATINVVRFEMREPVVKIYLDRLKDDQIIMNGYRVSDFAYAALDILGFETYTKNNIRIKKLIASKFIFD